MLYFACSSDVMLDRIKSRAESSGRVDDNEEILKKRVDTFEKLTLPVVEYYKQNHHIDEVMLKVSFLAILNKTVIRFRFFRTLGLARKEIRLYRKYH